ncbi:glycine cleavage system aminomethyltransferase GcvT [Elioraea tepida]|uniref:glycine cleavage system aminomethyltransferase GcvT n=1 Tax=Elioraea tepida TaxID=2843330 RepID=UPI0022A773A2|nr:glycine cleavage system aminomethyltransferase GcvT [Elioraea tepida]
MAEDLKTTPLDALHRLLGARMVPFAGYAMPLQYPAGIIAEHTQCRTKAALFDVSHMGQAVLRGEGAALALEALTPADVQSLKPGRQKYALLTVADGGILDDFMVANRGDHLLLVVNAACKDADFAHIAAHLPAGVRLERWDDRALLALQGPAAEAVMIRLGGTAAAALPFLGVGEVTLAGIPAIVSRSGYTGEDGFEISVAADQAEALARAILADADVAPAGLGARDSLRLEAGLCLYGNDIDRTTSPVEAALTWTIGKRRRSEWTFLGAERVRAELESGPRRIRVGLRPEGRAPARAHTPILAGDGTTLGEVTSGGFGPSLNAPVAMGYVPPAFAGEGTELTLLVRGKPLPARVTPTPFVPHRYKR